MTSLRETADYLTRQVERYGALALRSLTDLLTVGLLAGCRGIRRGAAGADDYLQRRRLGRIVEDLWRKFPYYIGKKGKL